MLSKYKYGCQYECGKSDRNTNNKYNSMQATAEGPRKSSNTNTMMDEVVNAYANTSTDTDTDT